jgi:uncharacterized membrane protein YkvA (DUF1232 family)
MRTFFKRFTFIFQIRRFIPFLKDYFFSNEVSIGQKVFPILIGVVYIFFPIDIIPDFLSVFGIFDDITLVTFLLQNMVKNAPASLKNKYEL